MAAFYYCRQKGVTVIPPFKLYFAPNLRATDDVCDISVHDVIAKMLAAVFAPCIQRVFALLYKKLTYV